MNEKGILESWKEISDYLKRSVRTCLRWEREFGLPVHRLRGEAGGRVFADTSELDAWMKEKLSLVEPGRHVPARFCSIAVLPIENMSGGPENDYFADGVSEVLITELGQAGALRVISHQSVKQFKGTRKPIPEIARMLKVEALVEGALLQAEDKVRLSVNLIGAFPERHLWAGIFECGRSEAPGLQRQIARAVIQQSGVEVTPQVEARLSKAETVRAAAYEAYLRGRASVRKSFLQQDILRSLGYFEKAIKIDPDFAQAYAEKAWAYGQLGTYYFLAPREAFSKQKEAAQRALELDPASADGYAALGYAASIHDWDWSRGRELFCRALELNPNNDRTLSYYAQYLTWSGRNQDAWEMHRRLVELDPLNPESHWNMGWCLFWARRYDESMGAFQGLLERAPGDHWLGMALGMTYALKGMTEQALAVCDRARAGVPVGIDIQFDGFTAYIYATAGKREKSREILAAMYRISKERTIDPTQVAIVLASLGENDQALEWFEKAYEERSPALVFMDVAPFIDNLRKDPRFQELLGRFCFPPR